MRVKEVRFNSGINPNPSKAISSAIIKKRIRNYLKEMRSLNKISYEGINLDYMVDFSQKGENGSSLANAYRLIKNISPTEMRATPTYPLDFLYFDISIEEKCETPFKEDVKVFVIGIGGGDYSTIEKKLENIFRDCPDKSIKWGKATTPENSSEPHSHDYLVYKQMERFSPEELISFYKHTAYKIWKKYGSSIIDFDSAYEQAFPLLKELNNSSEMMEGKEKVKEYSLFLPSYIKIVYRVRLDDVILTAQSTSGIIYKESRENWDKLVENNPFAGVQQQTF